MANAPVPTYAAFLAVVTKADSSAFATISQANVEAQLALSADEVASYFGDRATLPIVTWDGACQRAVIALAARALMGHRGYQRGATGDAEFAALAEWARDWLDKVRRKEAHPVFADSTSGKRPETPIVLSHRSADQWAWSRWKTGRCP